MKQIVIRFGLMAACLLILMQLGQYSFMTKSMRDEIFFSLFAILFLSFGFVLSKYVGDNNSTTSKSDTSSDKEGDIDLLKIEELKISKREYEVLQLINSGHSNLEISQQLFISESTVKSHVSSLLQKLNAKRRTQAIKAAREMQIL